jgi:hypothetical protein
MEFLLNDIPGTTPSPTGPTSRAPYETVSESWALRILPVALFGKRVQHGHAPRILVAGQALAAVGDQRRRVDRDARLERHERRDLLAEIGMRHADHGGLGHRGVGKQHGLHLARHHGVTPAQDQLLLPPRDGDEAVAGDGREVAGAEPAVGQDGAGLLPRLEIPLHDGGAPDPELARLARASRAARVVHDAQLDAGYGPANGLRHVARVVGAEGDRPEELGHP